MSTVPPPASNTAEDVTVFGYYLVIHNVFESMLKKPDADGDADAAQSVSVANEINKPIATAMAQVITGFGL